MRKLILFLVNIIKEDRPQYASRVANLNAINLFYPDAQKVLLIKKRKILGVLP